MVNIYQFEFLIKGKRNYWLSATLSLEHIWWEKNKQTNENLGFLRRNPFFSFFFFFIFFLFSKVLKPKENNLFSWRPKQILGYCNSCTVAMHTGGNDIDQNPNLLVIS